MNARKLLPPLLWAGVIVVLTSTPSELVPQGVSTFDKFGHFGMYAIFAWLLARHGFGVAGRWVAPVLAIVVASGFGAVDEWHQQFIPGRSTEFADWQADSLGAVTGALAYALLRRRSPDSQSTA